MKGGGVPQPPSLPRVSPPVSQSSPAPSEHRWPSSSSPLTLALLAASRPPPLSVPEKPQQQEAHLPLPPSACRVQPPALLSALLDLVPITAPADVAWLRVSLGGREEAEAAVTNRTECG
ncbi:hypothetical protein E2C01_044197 [Portunus trituberculatus]|uniref:Uncharacterized protein n=1 Tax=Portunus trituberculatus TaxID=210409 RepID=A0A5B7FRG1_PORTR|nr:hypothetical protein [Portunus trituberculatus]